MKGTVNGVQSNVGARKSLRNVLSEPILNYVEITTLMAALAAVF
jgi:hypothetical protein